MQRVCPQEMFEFHKLYKIIYLCHYYYLVQNETHYTTPIKVKFTN